LSASFIASMALRYENLDFIGDPKVWLAIALTLPPTIAVFVVLGFYRAVVRFVSLVAIRIILIGVLVSTIVLFVVVTLFALPVPMTVPLIYGLLSLVIVAGVRLAMRAVYSLSQRRDKAPVIIYGAGTAGRQLVAALSRGPEYAPVAFVDDDEDLHGVDVAGLRVYPPSWLSQLISWNGATALLLAMPSLNQVQRRVILDGLKDLPIQVRMMPGNADLVSGRASVARLREVAIEDLLGRDPVPPSPKLMNANIRNKVVMVTGAGGSIGSELCRQILMAKPARLILFEQSEFALYTLHQELCSKETGEGALVPILGSVCDAGRLRSAIDRFGVDTIYHAAAFKHVPMIEWNVIEGIRNNVFGTLTAAQVAAEAGVGAFILVSTDKAVRPTNIMGASKRLAELICQALTAKHPGTLFSMVRFGNVLGSSGSVIPLFRQQIEGGGPITVTHPDITRYFMTIKEAAQLVIQAGAMARGGDVFVLEMGEPVRIVDLAERMALLHGLRPVVQHKGAPAEVLDDRDIAITFTDLRPGEKLFEELLVGPTATATKHPRIMTAKERSLPLDQILQVTARLADACDKGDIPAIRQLLIDAATGYVPSETIADLAWQEGDTALSRPTAAE
jgi:FlaA1/EpsC-like NDP-sugar epimerase